MPVSVAVAAASARHLSKDSISLDVVETVQSPRMVYKNPFGFSSMSICIIGAGATGLLLLLLLQESGTELSNITVIDQHFDGGDLARKWGAVVSNTPWSKTVDSLKSACPSLSFTATHNPESTTQLIEIAHILRNVTAPLLKRVCQVQGRAIRSNYDSETKLWTTTVNVGGYNKTIQTAKLILTQGSDPKTMDLPISSIPLEIALDVSRLKYYVKPKDKVLVFGTMHSGTLVIKNLTSLDTEVIAYHNSQEPFYWARDNHYDGIKADAADIADKIVSGEIPASIIPTKDVAKVIRTSHEADWVVYAMGFSPRDYNISVDKVTCSEKEYDGATGRLLNAPAWGFGIAYPNRAPDGVHWDVSVASFLEHMKSQISVIVGS